jgi:uncharacterized membrane protein YdjX (TVP38/TMEM64 family)
VARIILIPLLCVVFVTLVRSAWLRNHIQDALKTIGSLGPWAPVLFIASYVLACLVMFPGIILTLSAGVLFGVLKGTIFVAIGATLGAGIAFIASRYFIRKWVLRKFGHYPHFKALDRAVAREGWKIVSLVRLSPAFPFTPSNFIFGLTQIPFWHFLLSTFTCLLPLTSLFVYIGHLAGDLANVTTGPKMPANLKWLVLAIALPATIFVTAFVTRIVRKALATPVQENGRTP